MAAIANGTLLFTEEAQKTVSFGSPVADTSYRVRVSSQQIPVMAWVSGKTVNGFVINLSASITGYVAFDVFQ